MKPTTKDAFDLIMQGAAALAEVEHAGMRVDTDKLDESIKEVKEKVSEMESRMKKHEVWHTWRKRWGDKINIDSRIQLGTVLFDVMGLKSTGRTAKSKRKKMDELALEATGHPFALDYIKLQKLKKFNSTFLSGIKREVVDGLVHFNFNLHFARTYRSSCDTPNLQNIPSREEMFARLIRSCFIPRDGHVLLEADFGSLEFGIAACFWTDQKMISYASNPELDIHRDMACKLYKLEDVTKQTRFNAKNCFVFPVLYGSYYVNCARNLWNAIDTDKLETVDGVGLKKHLKSKGIKELGLCDHEYDPEEGTYESHVRDAEEEFHNDFPEWARRKRQWVDRYEERGWFRMMTGFVCSGIYSRNDLYNYPVQGPAFHLLLWSLIQIVNWLKANNMKSKVVGQIHDSIIIDAHKEELQDILNKVQQVMTVDVRKHWDWVVTPLRVEIEMSEKSWFDMEKVDVV